MIAKFFIERPIFAWVLAIITLLTGIISIKKLPIEQYPDIAPPKVVINATYPGASAKTVENTVTQVLEESLTGIDHLRYFSSSSSDSRMTITVTFEPEADPDIAQVQTQNKVQSSINRLPREVQEQGVVVTKANDSFLLVVGVYDDTNTYSRNDLSDMLVTNFRDQISRLNGVGNVRVFGSQYAMRIWLNPSKLYSYNLTPIDVQEAIQIQNIDVSAGQLGAMPAIEGQAINATITAQSRLKSVSDFENIILRVNTDGSQVKLKDVANIEIGAEDYSTLGRYKRFPASGMAINLSTGANALETADLVKKTVNELKRYLPDEVKIIYPFDTTPYIKLSITQVIQTLLEAIALVVIIMFIFLQNIRATLIPVLAVPIVLLGTFTLLYLFGFSINVLTMFAMVLAIGLLVDDAIVVVENVERLITDENLTPYEAAKASMNQISGALVGIAVVLSTVFVPMAFFSGSAGEIYRQFSMTIVSAMVLSVLVALVVSPIACITFLENKKNPNKYTRKIFYYFNNGFNSLKKLYGMLCSKIIERYIIGIIIYFIILIILVIGYLQLPSSFIPDEDQGTMYVLVNTPSGATINRTLESVKKIEDYLLEEQGKIIEHLFTVVGFNFTGSAQNAAMGFVALTDWSKRDSAASESVFTLANKSMQFFNKIKDASAFAFYPPPINTLGNASGFDFQLIDRKGIGHDELIKMRTKFLQIASQNSKLVGVRPNGLEDVAQFKINIDNTKAAAMGLNLNSINQTLKIAWGSSYVNDYLYNGFIKRVYLQADAEYRMEPKDLKNWYVRNNQNEMVSFDSFSSTEWTFGSPKLERFNSNTSVNIQGSPAPGISSGEAMNEVENIVKDLGNGLDIGWYGISYEEKQIGDQVFNLYSLSLLVVFLCLAALYESWSIPLSILLVAPLGIFGAVLACYIFGLPNDIYFQVAILTTVGLVAKNAILIVEFAQELVHKGHNLQEAAIIAAKQRFRPIIMTSFAFILGVTPLAIATGAGSASKNAIGIAVMGGMFAATFIAILFVPLFYILIEKIFHKNNLNNINYEHTKKDN